MRMTVFRLLPLAAALLCGAVPQPAAAGSVDACGSLVSLENGDGESGAGFICEMGGARYLVTSGRLVAGWKSFSATVSGGGKLRPGAMETAADGRLARFAVPAELPALKPVSGKTERYRRVSVYGKDAGGALKKFSGRVTGEGPSGIEISAGFGRDGNGGPVLDENGDVLGVASFGEQIPGPEDWVRIPGRSSRPRRFAVPLGGAGWKKTDPELFRRRMEAAGKKALEDAGVYAQTRAVFKNPSLKINRRLTDGGSDCFVNGNIVLGLSDAKGIKNPVVRVSALVDSGTSRFVMDAVSCKPGGNYGYSRIPVFSYGMQGRGAAFPVGDGTSVYCIEGLSFRQPVATLDALPGGGRNVEYFDKSVLLTGGFKLPKEAGSGKAAPKIIAYRFECWQNGTLAGVYDSMRSDTLESRGIPADWFVPGRYPEKFVYASSCRYVR